MELSNPSFEVVLSQVDGVSLAATIFPARPAPFQISRPIMLYFHSGGITGGARLDHLPPWLVDACQSAGWHFVTVDYRLLSSSKMSSIHDDFVLAYDFVTGVRFARLLEARRLAMADPNRVIIAGASAGVYAAATLTNLLTKNGRTPAAFFGLYGQTNIGNTYYNTAKDPRVSLGPASRQSMVDLEYLFKESRKPSVAGPIKWFGLERDQVPKGDLEEYDQTTLTLNLFYNGKTADVFCDEEGASSTLRDAKLADDDLEGQHSLLPTHSHRFFPLLNIDSRFPPCVLIHGKGDAIIPYGDSVVFNNAVSARGVSSHLVIVPFEEAGHGFDRYEEGKRWLPDYLLPAFEVLKGFVHAGKGMQPKQHEERDGNHYWPVIRDVPNFRLSGPWSALMALMIRIANLWGSTGWREAHSFTLANHPEFMSASLSHPFQSRSSPSSPHQFAVSPTINAVTSILALSCRRRIVASAVNSHLVILVVL